MQAAMTGALSSRTVPERQSVAASMSEDAVRQPLGVLLVYALAYVGGVIAYTPFLMLALPARVAELAGPDDIRWLGYIVFAGAIAASVAGVMAGWLSDRTRNRRIWVAGGLAATLVLMVTMTQCRTIEALLWLVAAWQLALNFMLVPLIAWAGDFVPDRQKGLLGGLLSIAPALGAWSGIALAANPVAEFGPRMFIIVAMASICVLPLLLFSPASAAETERQAAAMPGEQGRAQPAVVRMWIARLLMQVSGAALASYLYYWLRELDPAMTDGAKILLFAGALSASIGVALLLGRWTDRHGHGFAVLAGMAAVCAASLIAMALAEDPLAAKLAYLLFGVAGAVFLALHASQTLRVLRDPSRRGTGIGLFNLTNTAPSLIMPWIAISVVPAYGFDRLFLVLAILALCAAALLGTVPRNV
jgi:MFS family permease